MINLREVEQRCEKATKGPWRDGRKDCQSYDGFTGEAFTNIYADNPNGKIHCGIKLPFTIASAKDESNNNKNDAEFISHARTDLPELVRLVREARKMIRETHDSCVCCGAKDIAEMDAWLSEAEDK